MSISRIYCSATLAINSKIIIQDTAFHHLVHVMRAKVRDQIILFNGTGGEYKGVICGINKKFLEIELTEYIDRAPESLLDLHLVQGIARGEKMDFIMQKSVELGVRSITPLITERCNQRLNKEREAKRMLHWQSIIINACEQSGRTLLPKLHSPTAYSTWIHDHHYDAGFVLSPHHAGRLSSAIVKSNERICLLIGPEGGFTDAEVESAIKQNFYVLNLGPRILRTETATIAALSILQYQLGDI